MRKSIFELTKELNAPKLTREQSRLVFAGCYHPGDPCVKDPFMEGCDDYEGSGWDF